MIPIFRNGGAVTRANHVQGIKDMVLNTQKTNIHRSVFMRMWTVKITITMMMTIQS